MDRARRFERGEGEGEMTGEMVGTVVGIVVGCCLIPFLIVLVFEGLEGEQ